MQQLGRFRAITRGVLTARIAMLVVWLAAFTLAPITAAVAATITVNTFTDESTPRDGSCSLREAINNADSPGTNTTCSDPTDPTTCDCPIGSGSDTINFNVIGTITLTSRLPSISKVLTIDGTGQNITVDGGSIPSPFPPVMQVSGTLNLNHLTIAQGNSTKGGGIFSTGTPRVTNSTFTNNVADKGAGIYSDGTLTVANTTFSANIAANYPFGKAGGIYSDGTLKVTNSTFSDNNASMRGGGIYSDGILKVTNSTFSGNNAYVGCGIYNDGTLPLSRIISNSRFIHNGTPVPGDSCGGLYNLGLGTLTVTNSTFSGNNGCIGGILNDSTLIVVNSTISGNTLNYGCGIGGIANLGTLTVTNSTISGNTVVGGGGVGGIDNSGTLTVTNSTISGNTLGPGFSVGGISSGPPSLGSSVTLTVINSTISGNTVDARFGIGGIWSVGSISTVSNSIVANGPSGRNCQSANPIIANGGYNISDDSTCGFGSTTGANGQTLGGNVDPLLSPKGLQNNGGPTETIALQPGSPAIAAIPLPNCTIRTDQRGNPRPAPGENACAVGAYEGGGGSPGEIFYNGDNITDTTQQAVVGQLIELHAVVPSSLGTVISHKWVIDGNTVDGSYEPSTGERPPKVVNWKPKVYFYWYLQENTVPNQITYKYKLADGTKGVLHTEFGVTPAPMVDATNVFFKEKPPGLGFDCKTHPGDCDIYYPHIKVARKPKCAGELATTLKMGFGNPCPAPNGEVNYGMAIGTSADPADPSPGEFQWVQTIVNDSINYVDTAGKPHGCHGGAGLDRSYPYQKGVANVPPLPSDTESATSDTPGISLSDKAMLFRKFKAHIVLEWKSTSVENAIEVPLASLTWGFTESTQRNNKPFGPDGWKTPVIQQSGGEGTISFASANSCAADPSHCYPTWDLPSSFPNC